MRKTVTDRLYENALMLLPGPLTRLKYIADLRTPDGQYCHWGLATMYGEVEIQLGLAEAHRRILSDVLSAPFSDLETETRASGLSDAGIHFLSEKFNLLMPQASDESVKHLKLVLFVLSCLPQRPA